MGTQGEISCIHQTRNFLVMGVRKPHLVPEHLTFEFVFKAVNAQEIKKEEDFYKQFYPHLIQYSSGQVENL
jgi:hypothetical protein